MLSPGLQQYKYKSHDCEFTKTLIIDISRCFIFCDFFPFLNLWPGRHRTLMRTFRRGFRMLHVYYVCEAEKIKIKIMIIMSSNLFTPQRILLSMNCRTSDVTSCNNENGVINKLARCNSNKYFWSAYCDFWSSPYAKENKQWKSNAWQYTILKFVSYLIMKLKKKMNQNYKILHKSML